VLDALAAVPREAFVRAEDRSRAHLDRPLPTSAGQTTSQPSLIARMLEDLELTGTERVLELGTGSGYQAALLSHLAAEVVSVEVVPELATLAGDILASLDLDVEVVTGDGRLGYPDRAPYDAIVVAAATDEVPEGLVAQLVDGGRLLAPIGPRGQQQLILYRRVGDHLDAGRRTLQVRFVPLVHGG
jgi:protein-L-isoaspartate(D-aspartate) O-methyltransferase